MGGRINEEEIELMDIFNILWKRKWLMIIGIPSCMAITGFISFLLKPVYEISSLIEPGKMIVQDAQGRYEFVTVEKPKHVASRISEKTYDLAVSEELKIPLKEMPDINSEEIKDTNLVRIWVKDYDVERGKKILDSLIRHLKEDIDEKVDVGIRMIDTDIKTKENKIKSEEISIQSKEIEKKTLDQEMIILKKKLLISENRIKTLLDEMKVVKERIEKIEEDQRRVLKETNDEKSSIPLLLYSNEVQNNIRY